MRKCKYCGFNNPDSASECLQCGKNLPISVGEAKKAFSIFGDLVKGDVSGAGKKVVEEVVQDSVEDLKVRHNPIWWLKVKLFRAKNHVLLV